MFQLMNKFFQKTKTNQKTNISIKENDSNSSFQDFCNIDDFEELTLDDSFDKDQKPKPKKNYFNDCNQKQFVNELSKSICSIILDSRKSKNNNYISINNNSDSNKKSNDKSFSIDIDELFLYNDFNIEKNDIQKFVIEFYLIKSANNKKIKINELVEKWKFSYKLNNTEEMSNKNIDINYLKKKILLLKKSIISYSRILPLYQYILSNKNKEDFSIDFKFYHNNSKRKSSFLNNPSGNVLLKNSNLFSFKMNIKYYSEKEIKKIFNETEKYIDEIDKYANKKKSLSFHKPANAKNGLESLNNIKNNNNPLNNDKKDYPNEIKTCPTFGNIKKKNDIDNFSESSSSFVLNIQENKYDENKINSISPELNKQNKKNESNMKDNNDNCCIRKCSIFSNSYETTEDCNSEIKINENKETNIFPNITKKLAIKKKNNKEINNIIKEYNLLKEMMQKMHSFSDIKTQKLIIYSDISE